MGQIISAGENINTIVTWPLDAMYKFQNDDSLTAVAGVAVGGGSAYYIFGNPFEAAYELDWKTLLFGYGTAGIGYWVGTQVMQKINNKGY